MERRGEEALCYSDSERQTITVMSIDGEIMKEYLLKGHPKKIIPDKNNFGIFALCDVDSRLYNIDFITEQVREVALENDGNLQLNVGQEYLYISNTSEINVISASKLERLKTIDDFVAISGFYIDTIRQRLYVVDIVLESIRIYDTESFELVDEIRHIGMRPALTSFDGEKQRFFIFCKGNLEDGYLPELQMVDVQTKNKTRILFLKDNEIIDICSSQNKVFLANKKTNKIDIIDAYTHKIIASVPTTLPGIQKLSLSDQGKELFITLKYGKNQGVIDILDVDNLKIEKSLYLTAENSRPLYVVSFPFQELQKNITETVSISEHEGEVMKRKTLIEPTKSEDVFGKIIKRQIYPCLSIYLPDSVGNTSQFERVEFDKEPVSYPSFVITPVEGKKNYYVVTIDMQIPYHFVYHDKKEHQYIYEGIIEDTIMHLLYIPPRIVKTGITIDAKVRVNLQGSPITTQYGFRFAADSFMKFYCRVKDSGIKEFPASYAELGDVWL